MNRKRIMAALFSLLLLAGCSDNNNEKVVKEETKEESNIVENNNEEIEEVLPYKAPLSGVGFKEEPSGRAYAVMINNDPKARPQSGLHKADIVYELLAEGNITRFLAIFQSEHAERIGPVRSARDYYINLAKGYDALYVAHGYSPEAKTMLDSGTVDHINGMQYDGSLFKRDKSRVAPHNSYITSENILKGAEKIGYEMSETPSSLEFLSKEDTDNLSGEPVKSVLISYFSSNLFNVHYEYDEDTKKYKRYTNGELTADLDSGEPVLLDNIFIVESRHRIIDDVGRREIDITSGGKAYLIQLGQMKEVEWKSTEGKVLPYLDGQQVGLVAGKTWVNFVPTDPGLENIVSFEEQ